MTTSLMALVGGATVASLSGGVRVWERAMQFGTERQSVLIAFERVRRDLQSVRRFTPVPFDGVYDHFAFAAAEPESPDPSVPREIGRLGYFLDERDHRLCRSFVPYRRMRSEGLRDQCQSVLDGVSRVRFSYFSVDADSGIAGWTGRWEGAQPPMAVKAEVSLGTDRRITGTHTFLVYLMNSLADEDEAEKK